MIKQSTLALVFSATCAYAQESNEPIRSPIFTAQQQCGLSENIAAEVGSYGETILFTGTLYQNHAIAGPVWSEFVFSVNQDSGSWTLVSLLDGTYACYVANGINFQPWTK